MELNEILDTKIEHDDFDSDLTIRGYFRELLLTLWREGEGFSGKRPFGNSGWQHDLYAPLIRLGQVSGEFDEHGYIEYCDDEEADKLILKLINTL